MEVDTRGIGFHFFMEEQILPYANTAQLAGRTEEEFWQAVGLQIEKDFGLAASTVVDLSAGPNFTTNKDTIQSKMEAVVDYMLEKDRDRFVRAAYRADLSEGSVVEVLEAGGMGTLASRFADLIMQREGQKVRMRWAYSASSKDTTAGKMDAQSQRAELGNDNKVQ